MFITIGNHVVFVIFLTNVVALTETREIIVSPANATVSQGDTFILTCAVTDGRTEESAVIWKRDELIISNDFIVNNRVDQDRYSIIDSSESDGVHHYNLQIENANALDKGRYQCIIQLLVSLSSSKTQSQFAWISYKHQPGLEYPICEPESEVTYHVGEIVNFTCRSELAVPPVELAWSAGHQEVIDFQQYIDDSFRVATVSRQLNKEDNGKTFTCNLSHELVTDTRNCVVGPLNVQYPPANTEIKRARNSTLQIGNTVILSCLSDANPPIESSGITWWFVPLDISSENIQKWDGKLVLSNIQSALDGVIVHCSLRNQLGESNTTYIIEVNIPPTELYQPKTARLTTLKPTVASNFLDSILSMEYNFLVVFLIGTGFILVCFVLLIFVCRRRKGKTIVVLDSQTNLRKISLSEANVNGTRYVLSSPVLDQRNRTISENPSEDSAIHMISTVSGDEADFKGMIHRNHSNVSTASSQTCGSGYHRVLSSELLIDPSKNRDYPTSGKSEYVICDMVSQNGAPFPSMESSNRSYQSSTTGRPRFQNVGTSGFETIPLRSVRLNDGNNYFVVQGGNYIPVQRVQGNNLSHVNSQVQIIVGGSDNISEEELTTLQESKSLLDPV